MWLEWSDKWSIQNASKWERELDHIIKIIDLGIARLYLKNKRLQRIRSRYQRNQNSKW